MATPTQNWGTWVAVVAALLTCAVAWGAVSSTVLTHSEDIMTLKQTDARITEILTQLDKNQALILQRLESLERQQP